MRTLIKAFKTEINPTSEQKDTINRTIGTCRYVYNLYIIHNKEQRKKKKPFVNNYEFSKWMNNVYIPSHPEKAWIKNVSSKSVRHSIDNACIAYKRFFKGLSGFPSFKKKGKSDPKMYFVRNNPSDCLCERHRLKIPTLGWVKLKEKGYIPTQYKVKSGTVSVRAGRYYVSVLIDMPEPVRQELNDTGIGIDVGIKELAVCSDGTVYHNINKTDRVRKLEKKLKREQRKLSRKYENRKKGGAAQNKNIDRQRLKVQKLYKRLSDIRTDHINKAVAGIVKTKPSYVTIEDLNVSGMMKNRHLSKAIASQKLYEFRSKLTTKAHWAGIEVRLVDRWYPSSKLCHACGRHKAGLKLSDRIYICECGYKADRDLNASLNLQNAVSYVVA